MIKGEPALAPIPLARTAGVASVAMECADAADRARVVGKVSLTSTQGAGAQSLTRDNWVPRAYYVYTS